MRFQGAHFPIVPFDDLFTETDYFLGGDRRDPLGFSPRGQPIRDELDRVFHCGMLNLIAAMLVFPKIHLFFQ
jgi:hypothetical protein